jgi:hypothetical protein
MARVVYESPGQTGSYQRTERHRHSTVQCDHQRVAAKAQSEQGHAGSQQVESQEDGDADG